MIFLYNIIHIMNIFIKKFYFCVFLMIVSDNTKYGVCVFVDLHMCCMQYIYILAYTVCSWLYSHF